MSIFTKNNLILAHNDIKQRKQDFSASFHREIKKHRKSGKVNIFLFTVIIDASAELLLQGSRHGCWRIEFLAISWLGQTTQNGKHRDL